jgi:cytidylate kinase
VTIAIDGPAGTGKSSVAKRLSKELNLTYINSGNLYRAVTLACIQKKIDLDDSAAVIKTAESLALRYEGDSVYLDGVDITDKLHNALIDKHSAAISAIVPIRHLVNKIIHDTARDRSVIVEGRDMTTVVFPDADYRFFLDASVGTRAKRRYDQHLSEESLESIKHSIIERDEIDRNKPEGSLKLAEGVVSIDTTSLTLIEVCEKLRNIVNRCP